MESIVGGHCSKNTTNIEEKNLYKINSDNNFKEIFDRQYQEKQAEKEQKNEEDSIIENLDDRVNSKYSKIIALANQDLDAESIARKLDIGIRETRLILKLYMKEEDSIV